MKKIISGILAVVLCAGILCGCQEVESSSVQTPMTTTTAASGNTNPESSQVSTNAQSVQSQTSSVSGSVNDASFLKITMKDWDSMNTDAKYINMESILKYITDSGIKT